MDISVLDTPNDSTTSLLPPGVSLSGAFTTRVFFSAVVALPLLPRLILWWLLWTWWLCTDQNSRKLVSALLVKTRMSWNPGKYRKTRWTEEQGQQEEKKESKWKEFRQILRARRRSDWLFVGTKFYILTVTKNNPQRLPGIKNNLCKDILSFFSPSFTSHWPCPWRNRGWI